MNGKPYWNESVDWSAFLKQDVCGTSHWMSQSLHYQADWKSALSFYFFYVQDLETSQRMEMDLQVYGHQSLQESVAWRGSGPV